MMQPVYYGGQQGVVTRYPVAALPVQRDSNGNMIIKSSPVIGVFFWLIMGLSFLWFPCIGIVFIVIAFKVTAGEMTFNSKNRTLDINSYRAITKRPVEQKSIPYDDIIAVECEIVPGMYVNEMPVGRVALKLKDSTVSYVGGTKQLPYAQQLAQVVKEQVTQIEMTQISQV
jgi:hypothetical protein